MQSQENNLGWQKFINAVSVLPHIKLAVEEAIMDWGEDVPTTVLFGCLGRSLAAAFENMSEEQKCFIFIEIESAISGSDHQLSELIATGLLEAMANKAKKTPRNFSEIGQYLGSQSAKYLEEFYALGRK